MHTHTHEEISGFRCAARAPREQHRRERGVQRVVLLTAVMMVLEIVAGYATGSMALLADGWHMATHVGALGLASAAYALSRRYASHRAFAFGTGKVRALAGYTSAVGLGLVALVMIVESVARWVVPHAIDYASSLPVAVLGLVVNLGSLALLHTHDEHHHAAHEAHDHDHNHRAALMHVAADALTSVLAILALLAGRYVGWSFLDALAGVVGGVVIVHWGFGLARSAGVELLDVVPSARLEEQIRSALEAVDDVRVADLHVWPLGAGARSCVVTLRTALPRDVADYRKLLATFDLAHLTIEVERCATGHAAPC
jgi:cation diffusion facilitator family transporter